MNYKNNFILLFLISFTASFAQELLTKKNAIDIALENNYGIKIAKNNVKVAENNASIFNSGYLPVISSNAGVNYTKSNSEFTLQNGSTSETNGDVSNSLTASIGLNYILFDGLGRAYNFKKLKETHNLSELEAKTIIQNTLLQLFTVYFEVAFLTENTNNILKTLTISNQRLKRTQYGFEYGQNTKLELLNAEVDINNDSVLYINSKRLLANAKRDLNLILGRTVTANFMVDTAVVFNSIFNLHDLLEKAKQHNIEMQKINKNLELSDFDIKISRSGLFPRLIFNSSYRLSKVENGGDYNFASQILSNGINAGLSLNWNLFDGGTTNTRMQNTKIYANNLQIEKEQLLNELERNVANSLEIYTNALFILSAEEKNVETNKRNFERTEQQFKLGQITTIEFRQAQINLLNAKSNLNKAKYNAKNAELRLLQLTGDLINTKF